MNQIDKEALLEAASYVGRTIYTAELATGTVSSMSVDDQGGLRLNLMVERGISVCSLDSVRALVITTDIIRAGLTDTGADPDKLIGDLLLMLDKTNDIIDVIGGARKLSGRSEPLGYLVSPLDEAESKVHCIMLNDYHDHGQKGLVFDTDDGVTRSVNPASLHTYSSGVLISGHVLKEKDFDQPNQTNEMLKKLVPLTHALDQLDTKLSKIHDIFHSNAVHQKVVGNLKILRAMSNEYAVITKLRLQPF